MTGNKATPPGWHEDCLHMRTAVTPPSFGFTPHLFSFLSYLFLGWTFLPRLGLGWGHRDPWAPLLRPEGECPFISHPRCLSLPHPRPGLVTCPRLSNKSKPVIMWKGCVQSGVSWASGCWADREKRLGQERSKFGPNLWCWGHSTSRSGSVQWVTPQGRVFYLSKRPLCSLGILLAKVNSLSGSWLRCRHPGSSVCTALWAYLSARNSLGSWVCFLLSLSGRWILQYGTLGTWGLLCEENHVCVG